MERGREHCETCARACQVVCERARERERREREGGIERERGCIERQREGEKVREQERRE